MIQITLFWPNMYELGNVQRDKGIEIDDTLKCSLHDISKFLENIRLQNFLITLVVHYFQLALMQFWIQQPNTFKVLSKVTGFGSIVVSTPE